MHVCCVWRCFAFKRSQWVTTALLGACVCCVWQFCVLIVYSGSWQSKCVCVCVLWFLVKGGNDVCLLSSLWELWYAYLNGSTYPCTLVHKCYPFMIDLILLSMAYTLLFFCHSLLSLALTINVDIIPTFWRLWNEENQSSPSHTGLYRTLSIIIFIIYETYKANFSVTLILATQVYL